MKGETLAIRRLAVRLSTVVAVGIVAALGLSLFTVKPAYARHWTCDLSAYTPYSIFQTHKYIKYGSNANCASGVTGRHYSTLERKRWWGWQELVEGTEQLNGYGNSRIILEIHCPGSYISEGTWTFRTLAIVSIYHSGTIDPWQGKSALSGQYRTGCYN